MSERIGAMFEELRRFVADHRLCGKLSAAVGELAEGRYDLEVAFSCRE